jgi:hypothetical protein
MPKMRAKVKVESVKATEYGEELIMQPVCGDKPFGTSGESEDNTFARYTPDGSLRLVITNPELRGQFKPGQKFYVDFTEAE